MHLVDLSVHTDRISRVIRPSDDRLTIFRRHLSNIIVIIAVRRSEESWLEARDLLERSFCFQLLCSDVCIARRRGEEEAKLTIYSREFGPDCGSQISNFNLSELKA